MNRRNLLQGIGVLGAVPLGFSASSAPWGNAQSRWSCAIAPGLRGVQADGRTNDRLAIQAAVDECAAAGGGVVYLAPGTYLTGTIVLKSNVTLYLEAGAVLLGSKEIRDYVAQSGPPPNGDAGPLHLVYARGAENISICGLGTIDGQGSSFWRPSGRREPSPADAWGDVATFDWKPARRPSPMVELVECTNVHVCDVTLRNSAGWTFRPIACKAVFIDRVRILNPIYGPNVDGIDITCCEDVFVSNCEIRTADDAICLKSENPYGAPNPKLTRNVTVTNCLLSSCCNGFKIGTSTHGGFENITFSNSVVANEHVPLNQRVIAGIALEMVDGGWIDGITITGIQMQRVRTPVFLRRGNRKPGPDGTPGKIRGVLIEGLQASGAILTSSIVGLPGFPVEDVTLSDCRIESDEPGQANWVQLELPELPAAYPEARMFGRFPAFGFYCRHVRGLHMRDLAVAASSSDPRPAVVFEDTSIAEIASLRIRRSPSKEPAILLRQSRNVWIRDGSAPPGCESYVKLEGSHTTDILVSHCDLRQASAAVARSGDMATDVVRESANIVGAE